MTLKGCAFTDSLRMELEEENAPIPVTLLKPGSIDTPFFEKARLHIDREPRAVPPVYSQELCAKAILECAERPVLLVSGMAKMMTDVPSPPATVTTCTSRSRTVAASADATRAL